MLLATFLIAWYLHLSQACRCAVVPTVHEAFESSSQVFKGELVAYRGLTAGIYDLSAEFRVTKAWKGKGVLSEHFTTVYTWTHSCGFSAWTLTENFGREYVVYTEQVDGENFHFVDLCSRTAFLESVEAEEEALDDVALGYSFEECILDPPMTGEECKHVIKTKRPDLKVKLTTSNTSPKTDTRLDRVIVYTDTENSSKVKQANVTSIPVVG